MSLEELTRVEVTSVSKSPQRLQSAPAAIYVITRDEIVRSGVLSIAEALRLAPNLHVARWSSTAYTIAARGFADHREVQTQSNKLLILVDGRTVYSPLFSGVFYDSIDLVMDDIDRIEVISGPGATLWGANAMNGVINIITRHSSETKGVLAKVGAGSQETEANLRYGATLGDASYRVYAKAFERGSLEFADGTSMTDSWHKVQGGFRADWARVNQTLTLQGDAHQAKENFFAVEDDIAVSGANALARWEQNSERSQWRIQTYYDRVERDSPPDGAAFEIDTFDIEVQNSVHVGSRHHIVWGAGKRFVNYDVANLTPLKFLPAHRSMEFANVFAQDTISIVDSLSVTLGLKFEDNPFSDWTGLPDVRVSWQPTQSMMWWAAASRAIRSPTPFDVDIAEFVGSDVFIRGNPSFRNEEVQSYEIGYRGQPASMMSISLSAFYADYDDLRTIELGNPSILPLVWGNEIAGNGYGFEGWANFQITPWWRLAPGFRTLRKRLHFTPSASGLLNVNQPGNDPNSQASLKSSMDLGSSITFDAFVRYVNDLPQPALQDYYEVSARIGWRVTEKLELSLSGFNLLDERHFEYPAPIGGAIRRSVYAEARYRY